MGTVCEVAVPAGHEEAIEHAFAEAKRIESMLSTWTDESELARVNRGAKPGRELQALLDAAREWSSQTNGAFDPRVKALIDIWKTREDGALPDRDAIANALHQPQIEEGAFGKGYAIDRMLALLPQDEALIDFGGQLAVRGTSRVTIADPEHRRQPAVAFTMRDASLSTSSGSEKTFEVRGRRVPHILEPRTGEALPPRGSVSVIADSYSTLASSPMSLCLAKTTSRWGGRRSRGAVASIPSSVRLRERTRPARSGDARPKFSVKE